MNQATVQIPDQWLSCAEAAKMVGVCENTFRKRVSDGVFPKPIRLGGMVRWPHSEIFQALERLKANRP